VEALGKCPVCPPLKSGLGAGGGGAAAEQTARCCLWSNVSRVSKPPATTSGKSGPKDQVALHYYYTSPSHWCTTHEVSKL